MIALPVAFLPFDPNRDYTESDNDEDDESCFESDDDDRLNADPLHDSINNGDNNHVRKHKRHIGGGVILVSEVLYIME